MTRCNRGVQEMGGDLDGLHPFREALHRTGGHAPWFRTGETQKGVRGKAADFLRQFYRERAQ